MVLLGLLAAQNENQLRVQLVVALVMLDQFVQDMLGRLFSFLQPEQNIGVASGQLFSLNLATFFVLQRDGW